ncbi:MAG: 2-methylisocitrate lyase [Verrucomicrobia bacterium]|nr:MAG: 2-methylisocitrate lyase [Verrucomicrobiota bacterium]
MNHAAQLPAVADFRAQHESGCFVLPNPWDVGTAVYLQHLGFKALATTSAGFAFSRGKPDGGVLLDEMLSHISEIVAATSLPVNADFLNGFADEPEDISTNVKLCIECGVAGLSIEDNSQNSAAPLYEEKLAVDRIRAAREAIDASGVPVVLTGRCEAWLVKAPDPFRVAIDRLVAYAEAGQLADLGVRRISVGSGLAAVAWEAFISAARSIATTGRFDDAFAKAVPTAELNETFSERN